MIERSIAYKAAIVGRDERELTGHRALLNLGHTIGHAIESASDGGLLHGECVGLGLVAACRVSTALGVARADLEAEVVAALVSSGLPSELDPGCVTRSSLGSRSTRSGSGPSSSFW